MIWLRAHARLAVFAVLVAAQAAVVIAFVAREEVYRRSGKEVVVHTIPVDPRDLLRGQYLMLGYRFQNLSNLAGGYVGPGDSVYVELRRRGRYWLAAGYRDSLGRRAEDTVYLRGRVASGFPPRAEFPDISRYYVREGTPDPTEPPDVRLSVRGDGTARIVGLEIDGEPWP